MNDTLQGKQDSRCRLRALSEVADEIGVGKVIYVRDQHRDRGGNPQLHDQARHGRFCHFFVISVCGGQCFVPLVACITVSYFSTDTRQFQSNFVNLFRLLDNRDEL